MPNMKVSNCWTFFIIYSLISNIKKNIDSEYDRIAISVTWMYLNVVLLPEEFDSGKSNKSPKYDKLVGNSIYLSV